MEDLRSIAVVALLALPSACSRDRAGAIPAAIAHTATFGDGAGSTGVVVRTVLPDGGEALRGETVLVWPARSGRTYRVVERAWLAAGGALVAATVEITEPPSAQDPVGHREARHRFELHPAAGAVATDTGVWAVPAGGRWAYDAPALSDGGPRVATPVGAWIALRAAETGADVRIVDPAGRRTWLSPVDQLAIATERGTTVVLGDDGADVDADFVAELRLGALATTLRRERWEASVVVTWPAPGGW